MMQMDYMKFGIEDFLSDDSFLEYCLETNSQSVEFWRKWLEHHPEKLQVANSARALFYTLNGNISAETFRQDQAVFKNALNLQLNGVTSPLSHHQVEFSAPPQRNNLRRLWISVTSVAAIALLAIGVFIYKNQSRSPLTGDTLTYRALLGKKEVVKLIDGSVVTLNGGSHINLQKGFNINKRELTLSGEAYFVVAHNAAKPFIVHTEKITIKDIGTEFNVKAYPTDKRTEASLIKGLVEISINASANNTQKQKSIILSPNKKFVLDNININKPLKFKELKQNFSISSITKNYETNSVVETDWTQNKLTFFDEPLVDIAVQMERWYGVKVVILDPALKNIHFTATFDHGELNQVLEALKLSGNFNYRKEGNVISIY